MSQLGSLTSIRFLRTQTQEGRAVFVSEEAVPLMLDTMEERRGEAAVQAAACRVLTCLLVGSGGAAAADGKGPSSPASARARPPVPEKVLQRGIATVLQSTLGDKELRAAADLQLVRVSAWGRLTSPARGREKDLPLISVLVVLPTLGPPAR